MIPRRRVVWLVSVLVGACTAAGLVACGGFEQVLNNIAEELANGPLVLDFNPKTAWQGSRIVIEGAGFSPNRLENQVRIGGADAIVLEASPTRIEALVGPGAASGPVKVTVNGATGTAAEEFHLASWPEAGSGEDGPPAIFTGAGSGMVVDGLPSTGTLRVLVVPAYATDKVPPDPNAVPQDIADAWGMVHTFYDQASYGQLDVDATVTKWVPLSGKMGDYVRLKNADPNDPGADWWVPNIIPDALPRLRAECVNGAVNGQGLDIDDYDALATYIWTDGAFLRAWGGVRVQNFSFADPNAGLNINIAAAHDIWCMALGETADWGRCAHELGHCMVASPHEAFPLGEDVYSSDLVDPDSATAERFDMMGWHDSHPLFSGYYMDQLGWYEPENIAGSDDDPIQWDRNPYSRDFQVVAHGLAQDNDPNRVHLVRIRVTDGLYYYIEVRQQPSASSAQVFDPLIPVGAAPNDGGVVVTKVITGEINNNQQMRFITLLHDEQVMTVGDVATDPARALRVEVLDEKIDAEDRLVCTVRVEWAQDLEPDPNADFDLRIEPWGPEYESPDIWIDRQPWSPPEPFDFADADGNPIGNGDRPLAGSINRFYARIHVDGSIDASNVRIAYYAISPPGVGDNGNWTPLPASPKVVAAVAAGNSAERYVNWTPLKDKHTCLQVIVEHQLGEVTYGNNRAQENVFEFEAPASSPPDPVFIPFAVRNPSSEPRVIEVTLNGVPDGYVVQVPHRWVYLPGHGEKEMEAVAIPLGDIDDTRNRAAPLDLVVAGWIPWSYQEPIDDSYPASKLMPVGGFIAKVRPKHRINITIERNRQSMAGNEIGIVGSIDPPFANQPVLVSLRAAEGQWIKQVYTDAAGQFAASFNILVGPGPEWGEPGGLVADEGEPSITGQYRIKAMTVNAPDVISTESNEVIVNIE